MEAIYDDVMQPIGFLRFAPIHPARGTMFGAAHRAQKKGDASPVVSEGAARTGPPRSSVTLV